MKIIYSPNIKHAYTELHKSMANVNIGTFLEIEDCDSGLSYKQGHLIFKQILVILVILVNFKIICIYINTLH